MDIIPLPTTTIKNHQTCAVCTSVRGGLEGALSLIGFGMIGPGADGTSLSNGTDVLVRLRLSLCNACLGRILKEKS